jgi:hypothetical protein
MYVANSEQAVKMRGLAQRMRHDAGETANSYYRRIMQLAALDLEIAAEKLERAGWAPHLH